MRTGEKILVLLIMGVLFFIRKETSPAFYSDARRGMPKALGEGMKCPALPPSVGSRTEPLQTAVPRHMPSPLRFLQTDIMPQAGYSIRARVLSRKDYSHSVAPMDLLVGWDPMAQNHIVRQFFSAGAFLGILGTQRGTDN